MKFSAALEEVLNILSLKESSRKFNTLKNIYSFKFIYSFIAFVGGHALSFHGAGSWE